MRDPFEPGPFPVDTRTSEVVDKARGRRFPCEIWRPEAAETFPLIVYSHPSRSHRRAATFLCTHLASHGYVVAAMDHSESVVPELAPREGESVEQKHARWDAVIASRVPDVRLLLDHLEAGQVGIVGHSFGGWTALAAPEVEPRIAAVVALAPGGNSRPKPGILPGTLTFDWGRDVPTLILAAENDASMPLAGVYELFERTPPPKRMLILRRADHLHFMDDVEQLHESVRNMALTGDLAWLPKEMLPIAELCSGAGAPSDHSRQTRGRRSGAGHQQNVIRGLLILILMGVRRTRPTTAFLLLTLAFNAAHALFLFVILGFVIPRVAPAQRFEAGSFRQGLMVIAILLLLEYLVRMLAKAEEGGDSYVRRVVVVHLTIVFGMFGIVLFDRATVLFASFAGLKTIADVYLNRSPKRMIDVPRRPPFFRSLYRLDAGDRGRPAGVHRASARHRRSA